MSKSNLAKISNDNNMISSTEKTIKLREYPNKYAVEWILENWESLEWTEREHQKSKEEIKNNLVNYSKKIKLDKRKKLHYVDITYKQIGANDRGRYFVYRSSGLQSLCREVRGSISFNNYFDWDFSNAHPQILKQYCEKKGYMHECLNDFVNNRDYYYNKLVKENKLDRDTAKTVFLSTLNGGNKLLKYKITKKMKAFSEEIKKIQKLIINDNELIKKYVMKHKPKQYGSIYNLEGSVMNHVLCGIENDCLQSLVSFLNANDFNVNVLCFDGCMTVKKELSEEQEKELITRAEDYVFSQTTYKMKIVRKPLTNAFNIPDDIVHKTYQEERTEIIEGDKDTYTELKEKFETMCVKIENPSVFVVMDRDGLYHYKKEADIVQTYKTWKEAGTFMTEMYIDTGKPKRFIYNWTNDPNIQTYNKVDFYPTGMECPDYIYNTFKGLAVEKYADDYEYNEELIKPILDHIDYLVGGHKKSFEYLMMWFANILIDPANLTRTAVVIKTGEGCGKNIILSWLGSILGSDYYYSVADATARIFSRFNGQRACKLLINLDEANQKDTKSFYEILKAEITNDKSTIENKGLDCMEIRNFTRWIFTTNNELPVHISKTDRRFALMETKAKRKSKEYYKELVAIMKNKEVKATFYNYCKKIYKKDYDWIEERPETDFYKRSVKSCENNIYEFFNNIAIKDLEKENKHEEITGLGFFKINKPVNEGETFYYGIRTKDFYDMYKKYCKKDNMDYQTDKQFKTLLNELDFIVKSAGRKFNYYKLQFCKMKKYLIENKYYEEVEEEEIEEDIDFFEEDI